MEGWELGGGANGGWGRDYSARRSRDQPRGQNAEFWWLHVHGAEMQPSGTCLHRGCWIFPPAPPECVTHDNALLCLNQCVQPAGPGAKFFTQQ